MTVDDEMDASPGSPVMLRCSMCQTNGPEKTTATNEAQIISNMHHMQLGVHVGVCFKVGPYQS